MTPTMLTGILQFAAFATAYVAVSIILSGLVSGIVALGIVQAYARERIQRKVLNRVFSGLKSTETPARIEGSERVADVLGLPEPNLCRLYYRQVAGQFLAAVNAEASRAAQAQVSYTAAPVPTPLTDFLNGPADKPRSGSATKGKEGRLHEAVRQIDGLQAQLGDAVSGRVMQAMFLAWGAFYILMGMAALPDLFDQVPMDGFFATRLGQVIEVTVAALIILSVAGVLAVSAAACGLIAFGWLDRFVASK